jgi:hypothetical protein
MKFKAFFLVISMTSAAFVWNSLAFAKGGLEDEGVPGLGTLVELPPEVRWQVFSILASESPKSLVDLATISQDLKDETEEHRDKARARAKARAEIKRLIGDFVSIDSKSNVLITVSPVNDDQYSAVMGVDIPGEVNFRVGDDYYSELNNKLKSLWLIAYGNPVMQACKPEWDEYVWFQKYVKSGQEETQNSFKPIQDEINLGFYLKHQSHIVLRPTSEFDSNPPQNKKQKIGGMRRVQRKLILEDSSLTP